MRFASRALCILAALVAALSPSLAYGQNGAAVVPGYDPRSEIRIKGIVVAASDYYCAVSRTVESHLILQTGDGTLEVHLAAPAFVRQYRLTFAEGEVIEVLGSRIIFDGRETLLAREIGRGEEVFVFRDATGKPLW